MEKCVESEISERSLPIPNVEKLSILETNTATDYLFSATILALKQNNGTAERIYRNFILLMRSPLIQRSWLAGTGLNISFP
ncbi:MAG: hypothetical protein Kow00121_34480 [Elainellaceae cyanobacterium]